MPSSPSCVPLMSTMDALSSDVTGLNSSSVVPAGTVTLYSHVEYTNSGEQDVAFSSPRLYRELSPDEADAVMHIIHSAAIANTTAHLKVLFSVFMILPLFCIF